MWRGVVLSRVVQLRGWAAVVHGRARGGRCDGVRQAGVVAAGPSEELRAQAVVHPLTLGHGGQGRVTHRPHAGVLTAETWTENVLLSSYKEGLEVILMQK